MGKRIFNPPSMETTISEEHRSHASVKLFLHSGLLVGRSCKDLFRSLLKFDLTELPFFLRMRTSILHLHMHINECPDNMKILEAFQILSPWRDEKVCWDRQPLTADCPASTVAIEGDCNPYISLDVTALTEQWYSGQSANLGLLLKMTDECYTDMVGFSSGRACNSQFWPSLEVSFLSPEPGNCPESMDITLQATTTDNQGFTPPIHVLLFNYTYLVVNNGANSALIHLEVSPNDADWEIQTAITPIAPGQLVTLVSNSIAKFSCLGYQSALPGQHTALTIYIQGFSA